MNHNRRQPHVVEVIGECLDRLGIRPRLGKLRHDTGIEQVDHPRSTLRPADRARLVTGTPPTERAASSAAKTERLRSLIDSRRYVSTETNTAAGASFRRISIGSDSASRIRAG